MADISLNQIWAMKSASINILLTKVLPSVWGAVKPVVNPIVLTTRDDLVNKIKLVQLYIRRGQLYFGDLAVAKHRLFEKIALELGRLEDIRSKITTLIYLEPIFNEKALIAIISDYNPIFMIYLFIRKGMTVINPCSRVRDGGPLRLENSYTYLSPFYYKDKLYVISNEVARLLSIDVSNGEEKFHGHVGMGLIIGRFGKFLYYRSYYGIIQTLNLEDETVTDTVVLREANILFLDGLIYVVLDVDGVIIVDVYNCGPTLELIESKIFSNNTKLTQTRPISLVHRAITEFHIVKTSTGRILISCDRFGAMETYNFETTKLLDMRYLSVRKVYSYDDRVYVVGFPPDNTNLNKPSCISVFDSKTFSPLGIMGAEMRGVVEIIGYNNKLAITLADPAKIKYMYDDGYRDNKILLIYNLDIREASYKLEYNGSGYFTIG
jgi:hypothetical protein